jgi:signal transduction histidine kinase
MTTAAAPVRTPVRALAVAVVLGGLAAAATAIGLDVADQAVPASVGRGWVAAVPGVLLLVTGGLLVVQIGLHRVAVVLTASGVWLVGCGLAAAWVNHGAFDAEYGVPFGVAVVVSQRLTAVSYVILPLLLALYPTGRLPRARRARWPAVAAVLLAAVPALVRIVMPWSAYRSVFGVVPCVVRAGSDGSWGLALDDATWQLLDTVGGWCLGLALPLAIAGQVLRAAESDPSTRLQLRWMTWAGTVSGFLLVASILVLPYGVTIVAFTACVASVCTAVWVAVGRHGLYGVDQVLSWTLVYGALATGVVAVDALLVAALGRVVGDRDLTAVAVAVVLLAYAPLREQLLTAARRVVAGRRGDPYGAVSELAASLESTEDSPTQLARLAASVAQTFATPYVEVRIDLPGGDRLSAVHGTPTARTVTLPISVRGEEIGALELAPGRARLSPRDQRLLTDLIRHATTAIRATSATRELEEIRTELVASREAAPRTLRRDLHDGLGPQLAAVKLRIEAAGNLAAADPDGSRALLGEATHGITNAVEEVRRLSRGLGPAAVEDVGLVRALEQLTNRFDATLTCADPPAGLPPAYEVAIYRIAGEALTNARRHAAAASVEVELGAGEAGVRLTVRDDGRGLPPDVQEGVGIRSMRARAQELGGRLDVRSGPQGCVVTALLPEVHP